MEGPKYSDLGLYRRILSQARPFWGHIAAIFLLSLLATPLALLVPVPLKIVVDHVIGSEPLPQLLSVWVPEAVAASPASLLWVAFAMLLAVALMSQLQSLVGGLLRTYTAEKLTLDFRSRLFHHVQRLSFSYHDARGSADPTYRIQYDAPSLQYVAIDGVIPFVSSLFTLGAILYITARLDGGLAVVALSVSPILFFLTYLSRSRLRSQSRDVKNLESSALGIVQEVLTSLRVVTAFGQETWEHHRFLDRSAEGMWARIRLSFLEGGLNLLIGLTTSLGTAAVLFIGTRSVLSGSITLGELLLIMAYLGHMYEPLKSMSRRVAGLQSQLVSVERAFTLLDETPDVQNRPNATPISRAKGHIAARNVSFSYDGENPVLRNVSFVVPRGTRVGVAGRTGAGKTSLMNLLTRFYDPTEGAILLDGRDLREYRLKDLRDQFAIVLQEAILFSATITENIRYARPNATDAEVHEAARSANAHDFILDLPDGYETLVGERGMRLSGGERQRIALARAFLKDAPILILDEPTSAVDIRTEAGIVSAMERLMKDRTTFMIAHRLSTLESCDLLLVMENGRIVDSTRQAASAIRMAIDAGGFDEAVDARTGTGA